MRELNDCRITKFGYLLEAFSTLLRNLEADLKKESCLPFPEFEVLMRLGRSEGNAMPIGQLCSSLSLTKAGMTRLIDRLEANGYVKRETCSKDRRLTYVALTDFGMKELLKLIPGHLASLDRNYFSHLTDEEVSTVLNISEKLRKSK